MGFVDLLARGDAAIRARLGDDAVITYSPGTGAPATVAGIFDRAYREVEADGVTVSSTSPAVFLSLADLPSDPSSDLAATVTVNGTQYRIKDPRPDGMGAVLLMLRTA